MEDKKMDRRTFGKAVLSTAAAAGLTRISVASVLGGVATKAAAADFAVIETPVLIIGTGYGASVAAKRLTEQGIAVTMLEMGRMWDETGWDGKVFCPALLPDARAMWFKDETEAVVQEFLGISTSFSVPNRAGILDVLGPDDMRVFVGRGVGGGSLVNLAAYIIPKRDILERQLPNVDADEMYDTYIPLAMETLGTTQVPEDIIAEDCYQYSQVGIAAAEGAGIEVERMNTGYDYDYMREEIDLTATRSALAGECMYGNNYGKKSLDKSYLADAMGTGLLTILALHEATRIEATDDGYEVTAQEIDIYGNIVGLYQFNCEKLFLGAGSWGTSELLLKSRERGDLPYLSSDVGTQWGPNSDIFVPRANTISNPTGSLQATVPSTCFNTYDDDGKRVFSMFVPFPVGLETFLSFNIVMTDNLESGTFEYDADTDTVSLNWSSDQQAASIKSCYDVFDRLNESSGSSYTTAMFGDEYFGFKASYHPLGGCPLSVVTDDYGRVNNYSGLYIIDGSLIPVGVLANPALTITALAERNIATIIAEDFAG